MKKYIFLIVISVLVFFASCTSTSNKSSVNEISCIKVKKLDPYGTYQIVTYEDNVKMKRYTIFVCDLYYGGGCTLIETEDMK